MEKRDPRRRARDLALPLRILVGLTFGTIVSLTIAQVFFRFALDDPLIWSEELVRILVIWMTFVGAAVVCWDGRHLNVDVVFVRLPPAARGVLRRINAVLAIGFLGILAWYSLALVEIGWYVEIGALDLPDSVYRSPATVGGVLMIVFILLRWFYRRPADRIDQDPAGDKDPM
jgi:TRAP-type C4-dicarboxylate transport system permease small subunit